MMRISEMFCPDNVLLAINLAGGFGLAAVMGVLAINGHPEMGMVSLVGMASGLLSYQAWRR